MTDRIDPKVSLDRFAEKLASFRLSLNQDEQAMLDEMVSSAAFDVEAHRISFRMAGAMPEGKASEGRWSDAAAAADAAEDVQAHALEPNAALSEGRWSDAALSEGRLSEGRLSEAAVAADAAEDVQAHAMDPNAALSEGRVSEGRVSEGRLSEGRLSDAAVAADAAEDVQAHAMETGARVSDQRITYRITFSPRVGYQVRPEMDDDDIFGEDPRIID